MLKEKVKIGCDFYNIVFEEKPLQDGELCRGLCNPDKRTITLQTELADTRLMETFLHECIHAIDDTYRVGLSELQVNVLGVALINLIRDNNLNFLK